jgi:hypothetical protein
MPVIAGHAGCSLDELLTEFPTLCANGFGISDSGRTPVAEELRASRERLRNAETEVETAVDFFASCTPTVTPRCGSYWLKHVAEKWGKRYRSVPYVSNGALIAAALKAGLPVRPFDRGALYMAGRHSNPNALVAVSRKSVMRLVVEEQRRVRGW